MKLKELRDKQQQLVVDARSYLEQITDKTDATRAAELEASHDAAMAEYDSIEKRAKRIEELEAREAAMNAPDPRRPIGENRSAQPGREDAVDAKAVFTRAMQHGFGALSPEERGALSAANLTPEMRALSAGAPAAGGYTVPQGFQAEIERALVAFGPMFDPGVTRQLPTDTGAALPWPTFDDTGNQGRLIGENTATTQTDVGFGQKSLGAFTYSSDAVLVSFILLQDSAFNLESEVIRPALGERIGRIANSHLTVGTGAGQPSGIVTGSTLGKTTAAVAAVTADEVIDFYHSIDPAYRGSPSFKFMFHDSTLAAFRKLKDAQNRYLIDGLKDNGAVINIAGISVPYVVNQAMPTMATGNKFLVGGDFNKYVVRRVREVTMLRLNERYADQMSVGFFAFMRADGALINQAAVKHLKNA